MPNGYQTWSEESLIQVNDDDDLHRGQRSSEVKSSKLCAMVTKLGQQITDDNDDLHRGQRSTEVKCGNQYTWLSHLVRCTVIQAKDDDDLHEG